MAIPFTFIHAADLHLDSPIGGIGKAPDAVKERLRESTFEALKRLTAVAKREKADFVVLAGDLYDAADRSLKAQLRLGQALEALSAEGIGVFIVHGNHDPVNGRQAKLAVPAGVRVFGSDGVECFPAYTRDGLLAAHVYGISYPAPSVTDNLALRFRKREGAPFHLAVLHGNVDGQPGYDNYAPCKLTELAASGFDYWALGHVHDRRVLHEYPHIVYPGNLQGRSVRETGGKGAYVVRVTEQGGVKLDFRDLAEVLWLEKNVSIEGADSEQALKERLAEAAERARVEAHGRPVIARFCLTGSGPMHERLLEPSSSEEWLEGLRDWLGYPEDRENWVWAESIKIRTSGTTDISALAEADSFVGELLRIGFTAAKSPDESKRLVEEALEALRQQPKIRRWTTGRTEAEREQLVSRALNRAVSLMLRERE